MRTADITTAHEIAMQRLVESLTRPVPHEVLFEAVHLLRRCPAEYPTLMAQHADALLGAAALIAAELDVPDSPVSALAIAPDPVELVQEVGHRQCISQALDALVEGIGFLAGRYPRSVGASVLTTFDALEDRHERLRAALMKCVGSMAGNPATLPSLLPALYEAMTSQSALVRGAAAEAYAVFAAHDSEDLPALVHQEFLLLLTDPYVYVHSCALEALSETPMPQAYTPRVRRRVLNSRRHTTIVAQKIKFLLGPWNCYWTYGQRRTCPFKFVD